MKQCVSFFYQYRKNFMASGMSFRRRYLLKKHCSNVFAFFLKKLLFVPFNITFVRQFQSRFPCIFSLRNIKYKFLTIFCCRHKTYFNHHFPSTHPTRCNIKRQMAKSSTLFSSDWLLTGERIGNYSNPGAVIGKYSSLKASAIQ
jgi:hypothetical protein